MSNLRDDLSLYLLTALAAIVGIASFGQAVNPEQATRSAAPSAHLVKLHEAQLQGVL